VLRKAQTSIASPKPGRQALTEYVQALKQLLAQPSMRRRMPAFFPTAVIGV